jgi:methionine-rich copper-binding protein CopC
MRRVLSVLAVLAVVLLGTPLTASAHDVLESTSPAAGSTVQRMPPSVSLTFTEAPLALGTQVVVTGPSGAMQQGAPTIEGRVVTQAIAPSAPAGSYTVTYRVTSDDGHPVTGSFAFVATTGLDGSTAKAGTVVQQPSAPTADDSSSFPLAAVLLTIAGTVVLLGIGGFVALRSRASDQG